MKKKEPNETDELLDEVFRAINNLSQKLVSKGDYNSLNLVTLAVSDLRKIPSETTVRA